MSCARDVPNALKRDSHAHNGVLRRLITLSISNQTSPDLDNSSSPLIANMRFPKPASHFTIQLSQILKYKSADGRYNSSPMPNGNCSIKLATWRASVTSACALNKPIVLGSNGTFIFHGKQHPQRTRRGCGAIVPDAFGGQ